MKQCEICTEWYDPGEGDICERCWYKAEWRRRAAAVAESEAAIERGDLGESTSAKSLRRAVAVRRGDTNG